MTTAMSIKRTQVDHVLHVVGTQSEGLAHTYDYVLPAGAVLPRTVAAARRVATFHREVHEAYLVRIRRVTTTTERKLK